MFMHRLSDICTLLAQFMLHFTKKVRLIFIDYLQWVCQNWMVNEVTEQWEQNSK